MEAPEKIFICDYGSELSYEWHSESEFEAKDHKDIEYTRTDVIVERAEKYLHEHLVEYWMQKINDGSKFIEDFIDYMKGEKE